DAGEVTELLGAWSAGDPSALDRLLPLIYRELHQIAARARRREPPGQTLQTTALVHEAYLRLVRQDRAQWQNREQFFSLAAQAMRRILVDQARRRSAEKRGGERPQQIGEDFDVAAGTDAEVLAVDEALRALETVDPDLARLVNLRFFGGLTAEEIAEASGVSPSAISREWACARAWLQRELGPR
ncbi:MAG TPA: sigma-70 family RNA polymerase sigma factor, partial [Thermoanaerobaculia bacterium]|nr:sigma-70 family RNA polymerase sigma factor [Thermoanaerobaculia bacterium]